MRNVHDSKMTDMATNMGIQAIEGVGEEPIVGIENLHYEDGEEVEDKDREYDDEDLEIAERMLDIVHEYYEEDDDDCDDEDDAPRLQ